MFRRVSVKTTRVKNALSRSGLPDLDYALNPYIGCMHNCTYCYARQYTKLREVSLNWGRVIFVKENISNILRNEVKNYKPGVVGLSTITDPYQPVEAIYRLTRSLIEILVKNGFKISIQTKNPLILRDLDLITKHVDRIDVGFTITSFQKRIVDFIEPFAPSPKARLDALKKLNDKGVETWIFYGPVIPGLNDDFETMKSIVEAGFLTNSKILVDRLHVKSFMYSQDNPMKDFVKKVSREWWNDFLNNFLKICSEYDVYCIPGFAEPMFKNRVIDEFYSK
ncbi:MAG: radical SAM protein [Desulfurococcaceae archaeon]